MIAWSAQHYSFVHWSEEFPEELRLTSEEQAMLTIKPAVNLDELVSRRRRLEAAHPMVAVSEVGKFTEGAACTMPSIADLPNAPSSYPLDRLATYLLQEWGDHPAWVIDETCPNGKGAAEIAIAILKSVKLELASMDRSCPSPEQPQRKLEVINDPNGGRR